MHAKIDANSNIELNGVLELLKIEFDPMYEPTLLRKEQPFMER